MKNNSALATELAKPRDVLNDANLVVDEHHGKKNGVFPNGLFEGGEIDKAVFLDIKVGHLKAFSLKLSAGVERCLVLGFNRNDVAPAVFVEVGSAL